MSQAIETASQEATRQNGIGAEERQYLTFTLGHEHYAVDILRVQEIKGYTAVTRIPNTPEHIKGVLNLRGTIVPIVELRTKFCMEKIDYTMFTVIVVLVVRERVMGIIVDAVSDVLNIAGQDIQPPPEFGGKVDVSFLNGIAKCGDKLIAILEIDRLFSDMDMQQVNGLAA